MLPLIFRISQIFFEIFYLILNVGRCNRTKVYLGGAPKRKFESKASKILKELNVIKGSTIDYGCGYGFDADLNNWDKYDPYYFENKLDKLYDTVVCINVLSAVSSKIRNEIIESIREILNDEGTAYLCVPRNIPITGKLSGFHRRPQNYVVLTLNSIYKNKEIEIYSFKKNDNYKDKTKNINE
jgi:hypothetical protein